MNTVPTHNPENQFSPPPFIDKIGIKMVPHYDPEKLISILENDIKIKEQVMKDHDIFHNIKEKK